MNTTENALTKKLAPNWLSLLLMIIVGLSVFYCTTHQSKAPVKEDINDIKAKLVTENNKASEQSKESVKQAEKVVKQLDTKEPPVYSAEREEIKRYLKTYNPSRAIEADTTEL